MVLVPRKSAARSAHSKALRAKCNRDPVSRAQSALECGGLTPLFPRARKRKHPPGAFDGASAHATCAGRATCRFVAHCGRARAGRRPVQSHARGGAIRHRWSELRAQRNPMLLLVGLLLLRFATKSGVLGCQVQSGSQFGLSLTGNVPDPVVEGNLFNCRHVAGILVDALLRLTFHFHTIKCFILHS